MSVNRFFCYEDDIYKDYRKQPDLSGCFFMGAGAGRFELIEFLQRGCGAAPHFDVGLRRRNNELNELTNCRAAWVRGLPLKGAHIPG